MAIDFLRHIVNPVINNYVGKGLASKTANELKKIIASLENKYKFDAFSGDPANLLLFFESQDFEQLVSIFRSFNAEHVLIEILEKTKEAYRDIPRLSETVELILKKLAVAKKEQVDELVSLSDIVRIIEKHVPAMRVNSEKSTITVTLSNATEAKIHVLKNSIKLEFKIRTLKKNELKIHLEKAKFLVEKISSI